ncbi:hypothetical protein GGR55DRAFT_641581 [Xylaria sp. FL0064]|nr:hypothetical protein GGR55DRAFT_641581 [Xylaria sp. FL0064]
MLWRTTATAARVLAVGTCLALCAMPCVNLRISRAEEGRWHVLITSAVNIHRGDRPSGGETHANWWARVGRLGRTRWAERVRV